jgi:methylthioribose-1-phosphate isomerase
MKMKPETKRVYPVVWQTDKVLLIDQRRLPGEYTIVTIRRSEDMAQAIETMMVRGAPAIGIAAAYGLYLGATEIETESASTFVQKLEKVATRLRETRPTAVNLFWAIARMMKTAYETLGSVDEIKANLFQTAQTIQAEDLEICRAIGDHGLKVLPNSPEKVALLTHCNTGALATAGYGTALGVIRSAQRENRLARVYATETRPRLQGAKLTTWECLQENIPVTLITDNMVGHCLQQGHIDAVIVGADRIAANGDTANKIGTYNLAILAQAHAIPFFVAAPISTIDFSLPDGSAIKIEQRHPSEIYQIGDTVIAPAGVECYNPAFDITPASLITGIITQQGISSPNELAPLQELSHLPQA